MKKLTIIVFVASLFAGSLFADGHNMNYHIHEGKSELNLSDWGTMDILDKIGTMEDIAEEVEEGEMPLKSYTLIHPKARLSEQERKTLIDWTESMSERLLTGK